SRTVMITASDYPSAASPTSLEEIIKKADEEEKSQTSNPVPDKPEFRPITVNFRELPFSSAIQALANIIDIKVAFDEPTSRHLNVLKIDFDLKSVAAARAFQILLETDDLKYEQTGPRSIWISKSISVSVAPSIEEILLKAQEEKPWRKTNPARHN